MKVLCLLRELRDLVGELVRMDYGPATIINVVRQAFALRG